MCDRLLPYMVFQLPKPSSVCYGFQFCMRSYTYVQTSVPIGSVYSKSSLADSVDYMIKMYWVP